MTQTKTFQSDKHREAVLEKIQKLLNVANDKSFEGESATAMSMAKQLLSSYGLNMSDVEMKEAIEDSGVDKQSTEWVSIAPWEVMLGVAVGILCDTKPIQNRRRHLGCLVFIGLKQDTELSIQIYKSLHETINRLRRAKFQDRTMRRNYALGMVARLTERARTETAKQKEEVQTYGALMVLKDEKINEYVEEEFPNLETSKSRPRVDPYAYTHGYRDGANVDMGNRAKLTGGAE